MVQPPKYYINILNILNISIIFLNISQLRDFASKAYSGSTGPTMTVLWHGPTTKNILNILNIFEYVTLLTYF